ncbi:MAG: ABC transporter ATP-binding protein [Nitrospiraceae bacterium]|nr:ABC transporter ATP-binding protein [Nitrospiraceae bacterium]
MPQVVVEHLSKVFKIADSQFTAVNDANLNVGKGDFISIVGHSGSGKSTLLSILGGVLNPTSGNLYIDGQDVYSMNANGLAEYRASKIGFVFQFSSLVPVLTAKENLLLPTIFSPRQHDGKEKRALEYLDLVGLGDKVNSRPFQLSGGQRRRVAIARAIMNQPELLLADEPTGDLDEDTEAEVMQFFEKINKEMGITFILVTHVLGLAEKAKKKFRMHGGKLSEIS